MALPPQPKTRSARLIWSRIAAFSLAHFHGEHPVSLTGHRWYGVRDPRPGALVALQAAKESEWCLSWVLESQPEDDRWLLESVETGKLAWWSDVSFLEYKGDIPESWRWIDWQHEFNDKWLKVAYQNPDYYVNRPLPASFKDKVVTIGVRAAFGLDTIVVTKEFPNYLKVRIAELREAFVALVEERKAAVTAAALAPEEQA